MAIPKKGSRRIVVDGVEYRWYIRHKPTYCQLIFGGLTFAVELASDASASTLIVETPYDRPDSINKESAIIRPLDVAEAIRSARKAGWQPTISKGPFQHKIDVGEQIQSSPNT